MQLSLAEYIGVDTEYSKICTTITVSVDNIGTIFFIKGHGLIFIMKMEMESYPTETNLHIFLCCNQYFETKLYPPMNVVN